MIRKVEINGALKRAFPHERADRSSTDSGSADDQAFHVSMFAISFDRVGVNEHVC